MNKFYYQIINRHTGWTITWKCCKIGSLSDDNKAFPMLTREHVIFNNMLSSLENYYVNDFYEYRIFSQDMSE